MRTFIMRITL